jgi:hypothetical protein
MDRTNPLAPCFIENGTVSGIRDMARVLRMLDRVRYSYSVDGRAMSEGTAALIDLMCDEEDSSTILVNGCLFLNVESFTHLTFSTAHDGSCTFRLVGAGTTLQLTPLDTETSVVDRMQLRLAIEELGLDPESFVALDEDDEEDA